jgi:phosphohistidine phosphatase
VFKRLQVVSTFIRLLGKLFFRSPQGKHLMTNMYAQAGAVPCRLVDNILEVLLISTSSGKNWTIPKGLIDPGFSAEETVHNEALEEAGIRGRLLMPPIGIYSFPKWGGICLVSVFVMMVEVVQEDWPEAGMRRRLWMPCSQAARQVKHGDLGRLIMKAPEMAGR